MHRCVVKHKKSNIELTIGRLTIRALYVYVYKTIQYNNNINMENQNWATKGGGRPKAPRPLLWGRPKAAPPSFEFFMLLYYCYIVWFHKHIHVFNLPIVNSMLFFLCFTTHLCIYYFVVDIIIKTHCIRL